jgi:hypothetical protein
VLTGPDTMAAHRLVAVLGDRPVYGIQKMRTFPLMDVFFLPSVLCGFGSQ